MNDNTIGERRTSSTEAEVTFRGVYFIFRLEPDVAVTLQNLEEKKRWRMHVRSSEKIPVNADILDAIRRKAFDLILAHRVKMRLPRPKPKLVKPRPFQPPLPLG